MKLNFSSEMYSKLLVEANAEGTSVANLLIGIVGEHQSPKNSHKGVTNGKEERINYGVCDNPSGSGHIN